MGRPVGCGASSLLVEGVGTHQPQAGQGRVLADAPGGSPAGPGPRPPSPPKTAAGAVVRPAAHGRPQPVQGLGARLQAGRLRSPIRAAGRPGSPAAGAAARPGRTAAAVSGSQAPAASGAWKRAVNQNTAALARGAAHADRAVHELGDALADGQAQPGAAVLPGGGGIALVEGLEQLGRHLLGACRCRCPPPRTGAGRRSSSRCSRNTRMATEPSRGELDGVVGEVGEHLAQPDGVAHEQGGRVPGHPGGQLHAPAVGLDPEDRQQVVQQPVQVEAGCAPAPACPPRSWRSPGCR